MFILIVVIGRFYDKAGLGQYSIAMAIALILSVLSDCGMYAMSVKEINQIRRTQQATYIGTLLLNKISFGIMVFLLLMTLAVILKNYNIRADVLIIIGTYQILYKLADGAGQLLLALGHPRSYAMLEMGSKVAAAGVAIATIIGGGGMVSGLLALPVATAAQAGTGYWLVLREVGWPDLRASRAGMLAMLRRVRAYAASALLVPVYYRADVMSLGFLVGAAAAGTYNAAYRVVFLLNMAGMLVAMALFPVVAGLYKTRREEVGMIFRIAVQGAVLILLPAAAGMWLVAPELMQLLFGAGFAKSATVLQVLCWLIVLAPLRNVMGMFLTATDHQAERARVEWIGAAMVWLLLLVFVLQAEAIGAAVALLLAEAAMTGWMLFRLAGMWGWPALGTRVLMSSLGIGGFYLLDLIWPDLPLVLMIVLSVVVYATVLALSAQIRSTEYRLLLSLMIGDRVAGAGPAGRL